MLYEAFFGELKENKIKYKLKRYGLLIFDPITCLAEAVVIPLMVSKSFIQRN